MVTEGLKQYAAYMLTHQAARMRDDVDHAFKQSYEPHARPQDFDVEMPTTTNKPPISADENVDIANTGRKTSTVPVREGERHVDSQMPMTVGVQQSRSASELNEARKRLAAETKKSMLSAKSKANPVPASRLGRLTSFGSLAAGLGIGTLAEGAKRTLGLGDDDRPAYLSEANVNRIVETLCKVRGAALKIGQLISMQDESVVDPQIAAAFERVRQQADFMPTYQMEKVMREELGSDWRQKFSSFEDKPFAAASIGQVHEAHLLDGTPVAVKIQVLQLT